MDKITYRGTAMGVDRGHQRPTRPLILADGEDKIGHIPNLGNYLPKGWVRIDPTEWYPHQRGVFPIGFLVDTARFCQPGGPALTVEEFLKLAHPGFGYAIVSEDQLQLHIGVFRSKRDPLINHLIHVNAARRPLPRGLTSSIATNAISTPCSLRIGESDADCWLPTYDL